LLHEDWDPNRTSWKFKMRSKRLLVMLLSWGLSWLCIHRSFSGIWSFLYTWNNCVTVALKVPRNFHFDKVRAKKTGKEKAKEAENEKARISKEWVEKEEKGNVQATPMTPGKLNFLLRDLQLPVANKVKVLYEKNPRTHADIHVYIYIYIYIYIYCVTMKNNNEKLRVHLY